MASSQRQQIGFRRGRRPLGDLTSQQNNLQHLQKQHGGPNLPGKPTFTIFQDNPEPNNENALPTKHKSEDHHRSRMINDENAMPPGPKCAKTSFPPPPPAHLIPTVPLATSSPAAFNAGLKSQRERESSSASIEDFDACNLYAKSSASNFRVNESISSTTTNEDCDDLLDQEDPEDDVIEAEDNVDNEADHEVDLESRLLENLNKEYALDILKTCMGREVAHMPKWNYMTKQPDITFTMRSILIDWLVEVCEEYKLSSETLFLAVTYIDKFLSYMSVQRNKLQLVGTACMFIAAKYEEIYPPELTEFCYITDDTYSKRQVLRMEQLILQCLDYDCAPPTAHFFVNHLAQLANCGPKTTAMANYLVELSLVDAEAFMQFVPSIKASAAVALARHTLGLAAWEEAMVQKTGYNVEDFKECLIRLHETFEQAPNLPQQAIREKYRAASYYSVSEVKPTPIF